jgi:hypothetical protein
MNRPGQRSSTIDARMKFLSTKSSGSRSEASRSSAADRQNEKTFFRGGTNAMIRRALENELESPLFPAALGKTGKLWRQPLTDSAQRLRSTIRLTRFERPIYRA